MTSRPITASADWYEYDRLVTEALSAFRQDVTYAVQVVESARHVAEKKSRSTSSNKTRNKKIRG